MIDVLEFVGLAALAALAVMTLSALAAGWFNPPRPFA